MTYTVFYASCDRRNNKHYSTLLKTRIWIVGNRNVLTGCESEASDCPCKVGIFPIYRSSRCASQHCMLLLQVQEIVLLKMHCTHSNIWVELNYWFLVVSSFRSPNKVLSFSQQNTPSPWHGASGSNNTTERIIVPPSFISHTFGWCFANLPTSWHRHVGACLNEPF